MEQTKKKVHAMFWWELPRKLKRVEIASTNCCDCRCPSPCSTIRDARTMILLTDHEPSREAVARSCCKPRTCVYWWCRPWLCCSDPGCACPLARRLPGKCLLSLHAELPRARRARRLYTMQGDLARERFGFGALRLKIRRFLPRLTQHVSFEPCAVRWS